MLFSSMTFLWVFLPIVLIGNLLIFKTLGVIASNVFLLLASLVFYAWGEPFFIVLMFVSILLNWMGGIFIGISRGVARKIVLFLFIAANLAMLGLFKYADMIVGTINAITSGNITLPGLALPIGISFYTFQAISYIIDVYRQDVYFQKNIFSLALYISFFPQLIAGPIVKYKDIDAQINSRSITLLRFRDGIARFIYGLGKKVIISNTLAAFVDRIYGLDIDNMSPVLIWTASILYTLQIYYDFSGYSDMAIGLGKMFGFDFKENFLYPYTSLSIREYWRRWHVSLSTWFREYVYIPLGGSRRGNARTCMNLLIVFFLTGLWHGANYNYLIWGMFHGLFLLIERTGFSRFLSNHGLISALYTFLVLNTGFVIFRIEDIAQSFTMIARMFCPFLYEGSAESLFYYFSPYTAFITATAILGMGLIQRLAMDRPLHRLWKGSSLETMALCVIMLFCFMALATNTYNPFIYFRF